MIDAVLSVHANPRTCGVTRFNYQLAARLGVEHEGLQTLQAWTYPLLSVKCSEWIWRPVEREGPYALFLHDAPMTDEDWRVVVRATQIYAANQVIARSVATRRPDVITAFCPSTVQGDPSRGSYRVLTFGMSNKVTWQTGRHYEALREQLGREHPDYTIELSLAVHEGSPEETHAESIWELRRIFGERLRVLGFLSDDALAKELCDCDAVALFYAPALRANNTTYFAAVEAGKTIYTNRDEDSPREGDPPARWDTLVELIGASVRA